MGAMSRKVDGDWVENFPSKFECPGIIDTGASKTVIGQKKVKTLIQSMPIEVQKKNELEEIGNSFFGLGTIAILPSVGALYLPFGSRWMRIEVVEGDTPFLLSNSCLRAIDADVCTRKSLLRLNQLGSVVPLKSNSKGLFVAQLAEVIIAFNREHTCQNLEVVTNVTTETTQLQQSREYEFHSQSGSTPFSRMCAAIISFDFGGVSWRPSRATKQLWINLFHSRRIRR